MPKAGIHEKSDKRILGHSDFIENVLARAQESLELKYALAAKGIGFEQLTQWLSELARILVGKSSTVKTQRYQLH